MNRCWNLSICILLLHFNAFAVSKPHVVSLGRWTSISISSEDREKVVGLRAPFGWSAFVRLRECRDVLINSAAGVFEGGGWCGSRDGDAGHSHCEEDQIAPHSG
jgi:hypothetical protein